MEELVLVQLSRYRNAIVETCSEVRGTQGCSYCISCRVCLPEQKVKLCISLNSVQVGPSISICQETQTNAYFLLVSRQTGEGFRGTRQSNCSLMATEFFPPGGAAEGFKTSRCRSARSPASSLCPQLCVWTWMQVSCFYLLLPSLSEV